MKNNKWAVFGAIFSSFLFFWSFNSALAGTANLSWNANTESDLAGYKVYYGASPRTGSCPPGGYSSNLNVGNVTSTVINNLTDGLTYYFSITAYDTSNNESCFSNEGSKLISAGGGDAPIGDASAPAVAITSPLNNAVVSSTVLVVASSTDNVGVAGIQFKLDGANLGTEDTNYPYSGLWDTSTVANGSHILLAVARDAAGNRTTSTAVSVSVDNPTTDVAAPSIPASLAATVISTSQVNLAWVASTDNVAVTGYRIYRNGAQIATTNTTSYSDTGLSSNTSYTYAVLAYDAAGNVSNQSASITATTNPSQQATLAVSLSATPSSGVSPLNVSLTASATGTAAGLINFTFYCNRSDSGANVTVPYDFKYDNQVSAIKTSSSFCQYTAPGSYTPKVIIERGGLSAEARQTVSVSAPTNTGGGGGGGGGTVDSIAPTIPTNVYTKTVSKSQIDISWSASSDAVGVAGYKIYRNNLFIAQSTALNYSNTNLSPNTTYTYAISAFDAAGNESLKSSSVSAATLAANKSSSKPPRVKNLAASSGSIVLSWENPDYSSLKNIIVLRKIDKFPQDPLSENNYRIASLAPTAVIYKDGQVSSGITYYYSIFTQDISGEYSDPAMVSYKIDASKSAKKIPFIISAEPNQLMPLTPDASNSLPSAGVLTGTIGKLLKVGHSGNEVGLLQQILKIRKLYSGEINNNFDKATETALKSFQCSKKIVCSGNAASTGYGALGPKTRSEINKLILIQQQINQLLELVKQLQAQLAALLPKP